jgi:hypothetical protein
VSKKAQETSPKEKNPVGRPSGYSQEIAAEICSQLAAGLSLRSVCKAESMPCVKTVFLWMQAHPEFLQQYEQAKEESADLWAEEILDIADDGTNDWVAINDPDNVGYKANGEHIQRSRLRVDARKWIASKLKPKKYGEKVQTILTGKDGGPIQTIDMSDNERARRIAFALERGMTERAH